MKMDIRQLMGIPYQPKGRNLDGVDCWGLAYVFHRMLLGNPVPSYTHDYSQPEDPESVSKAITGNALQWVEVEPSAARYGDVVIFRLKGLPMHCGVVLDHGDFIHTLKGCQTCIERLDSLTWNKRIYKVIRWQTSN